MQPRCNKLLSIAALIAVVMPSGCTPAVKAPLTYLGYSDLHYYKDLATKVDYPDRAASDNPDALGSIEPRRIRHSEKDQIWDLALAEAIQIAMRNNKIIRVRDQFLQTRNPLLSTPDQSASVFDPAIQETGILFGQRGVEAALSDFDAQFTTSFTVGHNEQIENNAPSLGGLPPGNELVQDTGAFRARVDKTFADSGQLSIINNWDYTQNNVVSNLFPSVYTGIVRAEYRRPLLAGAGPEYTRIAGPINRNNFGVGQGVLISRINNDMAIADFESSVQTLVRDVQNSYWDLSLAYHSYHAQVVSWRYALKTWRLIKAKATEGLEGGGAADEAQARDNLFDSQGRYQDALGNLYTIEGQFRRLLGLPVNDGRIIRPNDEPTVAEFVPDWHIAVAEGLTHRPEIRKQKWNIKSLELQLAAAHSLTRPRFDLVAGYQINAFGDQLISQQQSDGITQQGLNSAFGTLAQDRQTGWNVGFEAAIPLGFRNAHSQVRNFELRVARGRTALAEQELEVSHEIRNAFQTLDRAYVVAQAAFNRRIAAEERVQAYQARYQVGGLPVDPLLRAQQSLVQAEVSYYQSLAQYNQSITDFYFRTGTILEENNIKLAEDLWDRHAYTDALRRAWARSHAIDDPRLRTAPVEFVVPPGAPTSSLPIADHAAPSKRTLKPSMGNPTPGGSPEQGPMPNSPPAPSRPSAPPSPGPSGVPTAQRPGISAPSQFAAIPPSLQQNAPTPGWNNERAAKSPYATGVVQAGYAAPADSRAQLPDDTNPAVFSMPAPPERSSSTQPRIIMLTPSPRTIVPEPLPFQIPCTGSTAPMTESLDEMPKSSADSFDMPLRQHQN